MHLFHHHQDNQQVQQRAQPNSAWPQSERQNTTQQSGVLSNIFVRQHQDEPPPIQAREGHPVPLKGICTRSRPVQEDPSAIVPRAPTVPLQTNKFYANLFLGEQGNAVWTHPYSLQWCRGGGNAQSWGMGVAHTEREQLALGPQNEWGASQYFINPIGIHSVILSAKELGGSTRLLTDSLDAFSCNASFAPGPDAPPILTLPLVQGMGFVTGLYNGATPLVQSSVFVRDFQSQPTGGPTSKHRITLEDGRVWLLYVTPKDGDPRCHEFRKTSNTCIEGCSGFRGTIQIAKLPHGADERPLDDCAGAYPVACTISAKADGTNGQYMFTWTKGGVGKPLLMYALPHHVASFDGSLSRCVTALRLQTTTKGMAAGVVADWWVMNEHLPADMGFAPWSRKRGSVTSLPQSAIDAINNVARQEIEQDFMSQCCLDSMYFSGKGLGKFAMMVWTLHALVGNRDLASKGLEKLKAALEVFVNNRQQNPLIHDQSWKGLVSSAGINGDAGADFGNTWYNDHHFHYGYFVYTAAVITSIDPSWYRGLQRAWINALVQDFACPVADSPHFPFSRSFDWFNGHSWAKGLFDSADGKDEESTSEDSFASYAIKMWGQASGDKCMEARGNMMLAIQARSFPTYFLMERSNTAQPSQFIPNKVTGILFENKADHATYFGTNPEYIQGIHMIPLNPCTALIRNPTFVREEWETYFSNGKVDRVGGGWRGILYANLALIDARAAYNFFNQPQFDPGWLDGGASRTWYLAYCAALGGV